MSGPGSRRAFRSGRRCDKKFMSFVEHKLADFARQGRRAISRGGVLIGGRLMRSSDPSAWRLGRKAAGCFGLALLALISPSWISPAAAQEEPPKPAEQQPAEPKEPAGKVTEEITVTATLREEKVQDVPFSVAAPTEEELRERGVESIEGIAQRRPGFTVQNLGPGQSQVAMRGVSVGPDRPRPAGRQGAGRRLSRRVGDLAVALHARPRPLRHRRASRCCAGRRARCSAPARCRARVRYITNQPKLGPERDRRPSSPPTASSGGEPGGSAKVAVNAPLGDTAALRLAAYYNQLRRLHRRRAAQPAASRRTSTDGDRTGARLALRFQPNDQLTHHAAHPLPEGRAWTAGTASDAFNILANPYTTTRPAVTLGDRASSSRRSRSRSPTSSCSPTSTSATTSATWPLTSITSYTDRDVLVVRDATALTASITGGSIGLPANVYTLNAPLDDATKAKVLTQEVRLAGKRDRLHWVTGGLLQHT